MKAPELHSVPSRNHWQDSRILKILRIRPPGLPPRGFTFRPQPQAHTKTVTKGKRCRYTEWSSVMSMVGRDEALIEFYVDGLVCCFRSGFNLFSSFTWFYSHRLTGMHLAAFSCTLLSGLTSSLLSKGSKMPLGPSYLTTEVMKRMRNVLNGWKSKNYIVKIAKYIPWILHSTCSWWQPSMTTIWLLWGFIYLGVQTEGANFLDI